MRKFKFYSAALAGLLTLGACSSSDDLNGGASGESKGLTSYLAVNINNVGAVPTTKATRAEYKDKNENNSTYEDGEGIESAITKVRFYFFNTDGTPYILNSAGEDVLGQKNNYIDVAMQKNSDDHDHTVETVTQAKLVLNGESNLAPASMLTVVNPDATGGLLNESAQRFSVLRYETKGSTWKNDKGFVMSNSVYQDAGIDICSTQLAGKLASSADAATKDPVDVYVERVLAKVTANVNETAKTSDGSSNIWTKVSDGGQYDGSWRTKVGTLAIAQDEGTSKNYDVYAWVQGWGVADRNNLAELYKQIKVGEWTDATLGIKPWNTADYKRCFWSNSCDINNTNPPQNTDYTSYTRKMGSDAEYVMPNTPTGVVSTPYSSHLTKLLVAVKLGYQDESGNWKPAEICEYKGQEMLGADQVKKLILKENERFFIKNGDQYVNMSADNIEFVTSTSYNDKLKDYQVVAKLKGVDKLYIISNDALTANSNSEERAASYSEMSAEDVNKLLAQNPIEIRKDGNAYYYTPIKHLGTAGSLGEYGIVRNHSYKVTINSIKGFGTPVYDPKKVIIPTQPSNDKSYLAAKVNVLAWRVVNSSVDLNTVDK